MAAEVKRIVIAIGGTVRWIGIYIGAAGLLGGIYMIGYKLSQSQA